MRAKQGGAELRRWRKRKRLTQRELAFLVGCSHAMIGLLERDESSCGDELAARIAWRLDCDVEEIFVEHRLVRTPAMPTASRVANQTGVERTPIMPTGPPATRRPA